MIPGIRLLPGRNRAEPRAQELTAADGYVTKPITPSHLIGLATGLIERYRRAREQASG